jgi:UTP--glucose-1-phosphate uridylyltransferase
MHGKAALRQTEGMARPVRKAVFPVAGLGTRFLPATKSQPKEMLPLVDKPVIQYGVEEAIESGIENIIMVTGRGKTAIEDHFDVSFELENLLESRGKTKELDIVRRVSELIHVSYIRQKEALGLGHAVLVTKELVADEPFATVLADDVIVSERPCIRQLLDVYEAMGHSVVAVIEVPRDRISRYGVIGGEPIEFNGTRDRLFRIHDMVEKPPADRAPSNLAIIGRYVLVPGIFACLATTQPGSLGEIQLTDGIRKLMEQEPVYAYRFEGKLHDAGDRLGFLKATVELALRREDLGPEFREYLQSLKL